MRCFGAMLLTYTGTLAPRVLRTRKRPFGEFAMPTYQYRCKDCDNDFEIFQPFSDDALTACHKCGGSLRKVFGNVGITFKGSGFYKNDSKGAKGTKSSSSNGSNGSSGSGSSSEGSGSSSEGAGSSSGSGSEGSSSAASSSSGSSDASSGSSSSDSGAGKSHSHSHGPGTHTH